MLSSPPSSSKLTSKIAESLDLQPGDIIISETPYENPLRKDFIISMNKSFPKIEPGHTSIWTGNEFDRPFAHSVREGYRPPGLKVTDIWAGRHFVFRFKKEPSIPARAAEIMRNWAKSEVGYDEKTYQATYPKTYWPQRHAADLINFFSNKNKDQVIHGPATPFGEPRSTNDIADLIRNKKLSQFGEESIRRAIKFASLSGATGVVSKKGQRCTAIALAAYQSSIFAEITLQNKTKQPFHDYKGKPLSEYLDKVLIPDWRKTKLGHLLEEAMESKDFSKLLPPAFLFDQRYATPKVLYEKMMQEKDFQFVGCYSYFNHEIVSLHKAVSSTTEESTPPKLKQP